MDQNIDNFLLITIDMIVPGAILPGDVYIKLSENNYVVVGRAGTKEQLKDLNFYEKIKNTLYVKRPDLAKFSSLKIASAGEIIKNDKVSTEIKLSTLSNTLGSVYTSIDHLGFSQETLNNSKFVANSVFKIITDNPKLTALVSIMNNISEDLTKDSVAVSMISLLIAQSLGWNNQANLEKLALGAILHDIGLKEYPIEFIKKPRIEYTAEDLAYYERHAYRGVEILRTVENIPSEVMAIVGEHHENAIGQGYPRGLKDIRQHPFSKVVALADCFCELTFKDYQNPTARDAEETVQFIEDHLGQPFNKECFRALKNILVHGIKRTIIKVV
jgi:putative nucleotidyltransferase with HDIG domain